MSPFHFPTFQLCEIQNETFVLFDFSFFDFSKFKMKPFHFSTFQNSKLNLCTFRLFETQNVTFPLFDFSTVRSSKSNLCTFRLFDVSKFNMRLGHMLICRHQQSMKHQLNLNKNTTARTILPFILNQTMK